MKYKLNVPIIVLTAFALIIFPAISQAANFSLAANQTTFAIGDTFSVDIKIDSQDTAINAAQATLQFPKGIVNVTSIDKSSSVFSFWLQDPAFSNTDGTVTFIGGTTSGFTGKSLEALRVNFKVVGVGSASLNFTDGAIAASNGSGTNVLSLMTGLNLTSVIKQSSTTIPPGTVTGVVAPTQIKRSAVPVKNLPIKPYLNVSLYPNPDLWYNAISGFIVQWQLPADVTDVAATIDKNSSSTPAKSEGLFDNKTFSPLSDGIWYLHVQFKNNVGWGPVNNYRIAIDTLPPLPFAVTIKEGQTFSVTTPTVNFSSQDTISGIAYYNVSVDNGPEVKTTDNHLTLDALSFGGHDVVVSVFDGAGNAVEERTHFTITALPFLTIGSLKITQSMFFEIIIGVFLIGILIGWWLIRLGKLRRINNTVVSERDIANAFESIKKKVSDISYKFEKNKAGGEGQTEDVGFLLKDLQEELDKKGSYLIKGIGKIEK